MARILLTLALVLFTAGGARAQDLTLAMPAAMRAAGFDSHLLPRFGFRHRLDVAAVGSGGDMALGDEGERVFSEGGRDWRLAILTGDPERRARAETFRDWLLSPSGRAAIEGFAPEGRAIYSTAAPAEAAPEAETLAGDAGEGGELALVHCGRCHVVDDRNRMGGIGSTPSFAAMRGRENWVDLFRVFYRENPHPSFLRVTEVSDPFAGQTHVAPIELSLDEVEAILAFVGTLEPLDLGAPVRSQ